MLERDPDSEPEDVLAGQVGNTAFKWTLKVGAARVKSTLPIVVFERPRQCCKTFINPSALYRVLGEYTLFVFVPAYCFKGSLQCI